MGGWLQDAVDRAGDAAERAGRDFVGDLIGSGSSSNTQTPPQAPPPPAGSGSGSGGRILGVKYWVAGGVAAGACLVLYLIYRATR